MLLSKGWLVFCRFCQPPFAFISEMRNEQREMRKMNVEKLLLLYAEKVEIRYGT